MVNKEEAKEKIEKLVKRYNQYKEDKDFLKNERQVCDILIKPFFRDVLGWNIEDPYEFKSEYNLAGKRIDYLVCVEDVSQFVIEAKAPNVKIKDETKFYRQAVQYAEGKDRKFAILTNFKEFIILRAGMDNAGGFLRNEIRRIDFLNLSDENLDFLLYFAKEFWIEKGEDNPLYSSKLVKEKRPLDEVLVEDMSKWREYLLRSLKALSKDKYDFDNEKDLEYIEEEVQRFVDRLIFICYCEDKKLNDSDLKPILHEFRSKHIGKKTFIIGKIKTLFEKYNKIYNSDLFKEGLCDEFQFDDSILGEILEDLRGFTEALPYDFSVIDADILGRAYENFLGHIITGKKRFKEKKDIGKRKKMGIYYTPQYIVSYIIKNTLREKLKDLSFKEILKIKVLDPACGSGSFLIKVFDTLVEESKRALKQEELTYEQKKDLMLNCIHGVDLDERACDIAKLNLSLKLATRREKLPELHKNIQNGNSLIDNPKVAGDKAFNWDEKFPFKFDVVVGNPPYGASFSKNEKEHLRKKYLYSDIEVESYILFIEKAIHLLSKHGFFGFIIPNNILTNVRYNKIRELILEETNIKNIIDLGSNVFGEASVDSSILIFGKDKKINPKIKTMTYRMSPKNISGIDYIFSNQELFKKNPSKIFNIYLNEDSNFVLSKIEKDTKRLGEFVEISRRIEFGYNSKQVIDTRKNEKYKPLLAGRCLGRYNLKFNNKYVLFEDDKKIYKDKKIYENEKILMRRIGHEIIGVYDNKNYYNVCDVYNILNKNNYDLKLILGIINSKLINFYLKSKFKSAKKLFPKIPIKNLLNLPIKIPTPQQEKHIVDLVNQMLLLQKQFHDEKTLRKDKLKEEIEKIDEQIDEEVYKLYDLTSEEIKIVKSG